MTPPDASGSPSLPPAVSFVIPALNEEKFIGRCLDSIASLDLPDGVSGIETIVVDNESTDRTAEISRGRGARVLTAPPGRPSRARNLGAAATHGEWLAMVDADCEVAADWLQECLRLATGDGVVAVGGRLAPPSDATSWVARSVGGFASSGATREPKGVGWLPTAGLLVSKSAFREVGGFDESLTTCEDCDLGYRLAEHGRLVYQPSALVVHHGESTTLREIFFREAWRSSDNLRLALSRPTDVRNWLSLLLPVVFVFLLAVGFGGLLLGWGLGGPSPDAIHVVSIGAVLMGLALPIAAAFAKGGGRSGLVVLVGQAVVLATYFGGRALGLVWRFARVER